MKIAIVIIGAVLILGGGLALFLFLVMPRAPRSTELAGGWDPTEGNPELGAL